MANTPFLVCTKYKYYIAYDGTNVNSFMIHMLNWSTRNFIKSMHSLYYHNPLLELTTGYVLVNKVKPWPIKIKILSRRKFYTELDISTSNYFCTNSNIQVFLNRLSFVKMYTIDKYNTFHMI